MERLIATIALLLMAPAFAPAQNSDNQIHGQGYAFCAPIVTSSSGASGGLNTGFGGELLFGKAFGAGAELGIARSNGVNIGIGSIDFSYHILRKDSQVEPFAVGGPSLYFGQRSTKTGFNLGGGVNLWAARHVGFRFEFRDNFGIGNVEFLGPTHFVGFRIGMTFR
jgi:opacity protein-like surface antigen